MEYEALLYALGNPGSSRLPRRFPAVLSGRPFAASPAPTGGFMIEKLANDIWTVTTPLKLTGIDFGARMTIVRIGDDGLVLISPCPIDDALAIDIAALGSVRAVIAPNAFHHLYFVDATRRYPAAARFVADGVVKKIGLSPADVEPLGSEADSIWSAELEQCVIEGAPLVNEVVFYHGASRTLVLTDLCFNFNPAPGGLKGFPLRLFGAHGRLAVSRLMRFFLKDRKKVRGAIERILEWDFDRIVVTHGAIVESDGRNLFRGATSDL
jgi:hypothetical protein